MLHAISAHSPYEEQGYGAEEHLVSSQPFHNLVFPQPWNQRCRCNDREVGERHP